MAITAVLFAALTPIPQFWHEPPEKPAVVLDPLVSVVTVVDEGPAMISTLALFSVQITSPVDEFAAQEFTYPGVAKIFAVPEPSSGTSSIPV
jgi:hypothetical protein